MNTLKTSYKTVDAYIYSAPVQIQEKLQQLRETIKTVVPDVEEKVSYGMPYYSYKGRLAYFAYAKNHIGLYIPPPVISAHKKELENYVTATATVQLPLDQKLPSALIRKLIQARRRINEEAKKEKK
jgi:uncharacterized protein YdhG (YjbR/CyaY superfamily)